MIVALRRALAGLALGLAVSFGASGITLAHAATPSPAATATASGTAKSTSTATATTTVDSTDESDADTPDVAGDNSRQTLAIGGAAALALVAALVVFVRRR